MASTKPRLDTDPRTGEVRCGHRDCWGNVCPACFDATPFLVEVGGTSYRSNGLDHIDPDMADSEFVRFSPATPTIVAMTPDQVQPGDVLYGYTKSPNTAPTVREVLSADGASVVFIDTKGRRTRLMDSRIAVHRAA